MTQFKDIDLRFALHPFTGDMTTLDDQLAIQNSIKNLIFLNKGERHFHPEIATDVTSFLFELVDELSLDSLTQIIASMLARYEPRVKNIKLRSLGDDEHMITLRVFYSTVYPSETKSFDVVLEKIR